MHVTVKTHSSIGGISMLAEGLFVLTVSLSGNYDDLEFVGYFNDCSVENDEGFY